MTLIKLNPCEVLDDVERSTLVEYSIGGEKIAICFRKDIDFWFFEFKGQSEIVDTVEYL